jgi:hypothetical protein
VKLDESTTTESRLPIEDEWWNEIDNFSHLLRRDGAVAIPCDLIPMGAGEKAWDAEIFAMAVAENHWLPFRLPMSRSRGPARRIRDFYWNKR